MAVPHSPDKGWLCSTERWPVEGRRDGGAFPLGLKLWRVIHSEYGIVQNRAPAIMLPPTNAYL